MSLAVVHTRALAGLGAPPVTVEVHLANGLPNLSIVGLPETAVKESKDRVRSALLNSRFEFPARRITINLAPADLPKEGGRFDLPIAIGILAASGQIPAALDHYEFLGELALSGNLRPVRGVLAAALQIRGYQRALVLPRDNADEAVLAEGVEILAAKHLLEVTAHLAGEGRLATHRRTPAPPPSRTAPDLADIKGQHQARRALEVSAAGGHSMLLMGPPGSGKTMLASRLPGILPPLTDEEALQTAAIQSLCDQGFAPAMWKKRPYRAPHHTASAVALVGGGSCPRPGEISLAHNGVLFLDELPEFDRRVLEVLREPLESGVINISRASRQAQFPARFQLIAAMNPCPCGYHGDPAGRCRCTEDRISNYRSRISGPLLDRIDIQLTVPPVPRELLTGGDIKRGENSSDVARRVAAARRRQVARNGCANHMLGNHQIEAACPLDVPERQLLEQAMSRLRLSARAYHRVLKVARTIADLAGAEKISVTHLGEALQYRGLDRPL